MFLKYGFNKMYALNRHVEFTFRNQYFFFFFFANYCEKMLK